MAQLLGVHGWGGDPLEKLCHGLGIHACLRQVALLYIIERRLNRLNILHLLALLGSSALRLVGDGEQIGHHSLNGGNIGEALRDCGVLLVDRGNLVHVVRLVDAVHEIDALLDGATIVLLVQELLDFLLITLSLKLA